MEGLTGKVWAQRLKLMALKAPLGGPFDLVSRVSKVGYGDYKRVSRGY